jgi:hypothetical protein
MALFVGEKRFCKIIWMEGGRTVVRRIFKMAIQQPSGLIEIVEGKDLPDAIVLETGPTAKGKPTMQAIMSPESRKAEWESGRFPIEHSWPRQRDLIHMGAGFTALGLIRLYILLSQATQ